MRLQIHHRTAYHYDTPVPYAIQTLRLAPGGHDGLRILHWQVRGDSRKELPAYRDGYGNTVHCHTVKRHHSSSAVSVEGVVETNDTNGVLTGVQETLPPAFFLRPTPLTTPSPRLMELAKQASSQAAVLDRLHEAMRLVNEAVQYRAGHAHTGTTAADVLERGAGACLDHAHVFITVARLMGVPARYVSGYLWTCGTSVNEEACHAWAEAWVEHLGWVGFDPSHVICPTEAYVRIASGLDYWSAAPIRAVRRGEATERMEVRVHVEHSVQQQ